MAAFNLCFLAFILAVFSLTCQGNEKHMICKQVKDVFSDDNGIVPVTTRHRSQGTPCKRGVKGNKGDLGQNGAQGPPGEVDYRRVEAMVERKVNEELSALNAKLGEMNRVINSLNTSLTDSQNMMAKVKKYVCKITSNGRCIYGVFPSLTSSSVNYAKAVELCLPKGGKPADVYGEIEYMMIADYMRSEIPSTMTLITAWLGMASNPSAGTITLSNGASAPTLKFYPRYPYSSPSHTNVGIHIDKNPASSSQGIHNFPPTYHRHGVICEI